LLQLVNRPQEVVAALQQLQQAYLNYYTSTNDYNRAQFQLFRALGYAAQSLACGDSLGPVMPVDPPARHRWRRSTRRSRATVASAEALSPSSAAGPIQLTVAFAAPGTAAKGSLSRCDRQTITFQYLTVVPSQVEAVPARIKTPRGPIALRYITCRFCSDILSHHR
jgi:hypothetical protein